MSDNIDIYVDSAPVDIVVSGAQGPSTSGGSSDVAAAINDATAKTTPVDADRMALTDSSASFALRKVTWANVKATLKTYFDTLYSAVSHHTWSSLTGDANHVPFDTTPTSVPTGAGVVSWNVDDDTLDIQTGLGGVVTQVGQEQHVKVRNNSGATITNGSVVYLSGASGQRPTISLADADNDTHVASTIGLATADIGNNSFGMVTTSGLVRGVNTVGMTAGSPIYLSGTAGGMTQTAPASNIVRVGWCIVAGNNGTVLVHVEKMSVKSVDVLDASTGGNGVADAGKLVKFGSSGEINAYAQSLSAIVGTSETGDAVLGDSDSGVGIFGTSDSGVGVSGTSDSGIASQAISNSSTALAASTNTGEYHATFGDTGANQSFVARVNGAFGWVRGAYTSRVQAPATLTDNRVHNTPDGNGTFALVGQDDGTITLGDVTDWPGGLTREVIGYAIVGPTGEGNINTIEDLDSIYVGRLDVALVTSITNLLTWIKGKASAVFSAGDLMKWAATAADTRTNLGAQATLVSGTNIKPVAGQSLLGSANIPALLTDPTGVTGADALTNIISLTQAEYNAIGSKSSTTLYIIT